jgi:hypothetical protein
MTKQKRMSFLFAKATYYYLSFLSGGGGGGAHAEQNGMIN